MYTNTEKKKRFDSSGVDFQTVKYMNERDGLAYSSKNNTTGKLLFEENLKITSLEFIKEIRKLDVDVDCELVGFFGPCLIQPLSGRAVVDTIYFQ